MRYIKWCVWGIACLGISGCFGPVRQPPIKTYALQASEHTLHARNSNGPVVLVNLPVASPGYDSNAMLYTQHPYQLTSFSYHRWVAAPADMLQPLIVRSLQNSGCFGAVVSSPFVGDTQMVVDTHLLELQQEFGENCSHVRMAISWDAVDTATHRVIAHGRFETVVPASADTPYAGVKAANAATQILLDRWTHALCGAVK